MAVRIPRAPRHGAELRVAFFTRHSAMKPSSRVRVFQYRKYLRREGIDTRVLVGSGRLHPARQTTYVPRAIGLARWADVLVLQKPHQPPWLIDILAKINPRIVVDLTDAVWAKPESRRRLVHAMNRSGVTTVGSQCLASWARENCPGNAVSVIPEAVDLETYGSRGSPTTDASVVLGWIGTPGNLPDFRPVLPVLARLVDGSHTRLRIVSSRPLDAEAPPCEFEDRKSVV
jgi:hypothetical protein